jgi:hypothetical protein
MFEIIDMTWPASVSCNAGPTPVVGHVRDLNAGPVFQELHCEMKIAADAGRAIVELAGRRLGGGDVVCQRLHRLRCVHHQHVRHRDHLGHRREVAQHVIRQLLGDEMVDGDGAGAEQKRVAIGRRADHGVDAEHVAGPAAVLDIELLAQHLAEVQGIHARQRVRGAARCGGHQDFHGLVRPGRLRLRTAGNQKHSDQR